MTQVLMAMRIAHRALRRNTCARALTMLGVIIGVAAVIAMLRHWTGGAGGHPCADRQPRLALARHSAGLDDAERGAVWLGESHDPACA